MPVPTRIGTPHKPGATRVMVLGAGELGKEIVIAFQRLGVEVIAVDRYPGAPGQQVAHSAYTIDMGDAELLGSVIRRERPDFVVPEIEAIATEALVAIEGDGVAEVIPNARATVTTMNREGIRRLAAVDLGLPTSRFLFASSADEVRSAAESLGYPCVVKPVMSSSGKGQSVLRSPEGVDATWAAALAGGRVDHGRVIVEEFVDFDYELTQLTIRGIDPRTGEVATYFCEPIGHRQVDGDYVESWQPHEISAGVRDAVRSVAGRITGALGGRGVFGVEVFVKGDEVYFSEVSPRPHDTGLVTLATQRFSEFELHARAILGLPIDTTLISPGASAVVYGGLDAEGIGYEGVAAALSVPETDVRLFGKPESHIRRRMGVVVSTDETVEGARRRAREAAAAVRPVP